MKSTCPSRIRWYSSAIGSLTLRTSSAVSHTSSAVARIFAPAAANSSSVMLEPTPAPASTKTSWPWRVNSLTPAGVIATRYSWFLTSRGIPTFTMQTPSSGAAHPRLRGAAPAPLPARYTGPAGGSLEPWEAHGRRHCDIRCPLVLTVCQAWARLAGGDVISRQDRVR